MSFWEWFEAQCERTDIWSSNADEHNRYAHPPKGVDPIHWGHMLLKLKYEFSPHRPNKEEDSDG